MKGPEHRFGSFGVIQTRTSPTFSGHNWNNAKQKQGE
jgi:hypothetical protein